MGDVGFHPTQLPWTLQEGKNIPLLRQDCIPDPIRKTILENLGKVPLWEGGMTIPGQTRVLSFPELLISYPHTASHETYVGHLSHLLGCWHKADNPGRAHRD